MTIVMGLDQHRAQITAEWIDTATGEVSRARVAPIDASSGNTQRQRLDPGGNRQINAALHRVIVTRARCHQPTRDYIERRRREGRPPATRSAASSATSPAKSGTCSAPPPRT